MQNGKKLVWVGIILMLLGMAACADVAPHVKQSPQFKDGQFQNPTPPTRKAGLWSFLTYRFTVEKGEWPEWIENTATPELQKNPDEIVITFINHATFLAEIDGVKILFDPVFSDFVGPTSWLGVKRRRAPGLAIEDLPKIDVIFVSHNHYEHLDLPALKHLSAKYRPHIFVPLGDKGWLSKALKRHGAPPMTEMDWWQDTTFTAPSGDSLEVHFVPAQHWSRRGVFDRNKSLWGGFVIRHPRITLYHSGDTGYAEHFKDIGERFDIDIAMLAIGDYLPDWFVGYSHMKPADAVVAHRELGARLSFGMHSETFLLTSTAYGEAEEDLRRALVDNPDIKNDVRKLEVGESFRWQALQ